MSTPSDLRIHDAEPVRNGRRPPVTVRQVIELYIQAHRDMFSAESQRERERILLLFANSSGVGELPISRCKAHYLEDWIAARPGLKSGHTRNRWVHSVTAAFTWAVKGGRIRANPFRGVHFRPGKRGRDIDPATCSAVLIEHKTARLGEARRIVLNEVVLKLLVRILDDQERRGIVTDHVFLNKRDKPWSKRIVCQHLARLRKRARVPKDVKLHGARHLFGTTFILNGGDIATLAELLGHRSIKTTQIYLHLAGQTEHLQLAAELVTKARK